MPRLLGYICGREGWWREMGTRRSVSARLPASGSGMVRATGDAHDPLESEADRLLAATCQRLGMLGVRFFTEDDLKENDPSGKDLLEQSQYRVEIESYVRQIRNAELKDMNIRREEYSNYKDAVISYVLCRGVAAQFHLFQTQMHETANLSELIHSINDKAFAAYDLVLEMQRSMNLPKIDFGAMNTRHEKYGIHGFVRRRGEIVDSDGAPIGEGGTEPGRGSEDSSPFEEGTGAASESVRAARAYVQAVKDAESGS